MTAWTAFAPQTPLGLGVIPSAIAPTVRDALAAHDVARGGVWNASTRLWQRYDRPWDGAGGTRGTARLMGTVSTMPGEVNPRDIAMIRVMVTPDGRAAGWTESGLCDDALQHADESLASLATASARDAKRPKRAVPAPVPGTVRELLHSDVGVVLRSDVRELVRLLAKRNRGG